jgi:hypothetical protein
MSNQSIDIDIIDIRKMNTDNTDNTEQKEQTEAVVPFKPDFSKYTTIPNIIDNIRNSGTILHQTNSVAKKIDEFLSMNAKDIPWSNKTWIAPQGPVSTICVEPFMTPVLGGSSIPDLRKPAILCWYSGNFSENDQYFVFDNLCKLFSPIGIWSCVAFNTNVNSTHVYEGKNMSDKFKILVIPYPSYRHI